MKFLLISILSFISSVTFLLFLLGNKNFLPVTLTGEMNHVNILVLMFLLIIALFSFFLITLYFVFKYFKKELEEGERIKKSIKFSIIFTLGLLLVFLLHFFHILDFIWGFIILVIALLLIFVV